MRCRFLLIGFILCPATAWAFMGSEMVPLIQLVTGQVQEIERLAQTIGLARDQLELIRQLNDGIDKTVTQITSLQQLIERVQGLNPQSVRSLSDLNDLLERTKATQETVEELIEIKVALADQAIDRTALQSENAYLMGQEMVATGSVLANESQTASPGRAAQITAAAGSAQMLSQGVQLQTLAQVAEIQALLLEFQKAQLQMEAEGTLSRRENVLRHLSKKPSLRRTR